MSGYPPSELDYSRLLVYPTRDDVVTYAPLPGWDDLLAEVADEITGTAPASILDLSGGVERVLGRGTALGAVKASSSPTARLGARLATRFAHAVPLHRCKVGSQPACHGVQIGEPRAAIVHRVQLGYHVDTKNPYPCLNATVVFRDAGGVLDGVLVFPDEDLGVAQQPGWVSIFDGQRRHGVTPYTGGRVSLTYYLPVEILP